MCQSLNWDFAIYFLIFLVMPEIVPNGATKYDFKIIYEWTQIEYNFESEDQRSEAIENGTFNIGKIEPTDAQYTYDVDSDRERIFIMTPRLDPKGVPATVGVIINKTRDSNPVIEPYPSWSWHISPEKCHYHRIVSVFRVWADECNRLWMVDDGVVGKAFLCPPQILIFDLRTDILLNKYELPYEQYQNVSWYIAHTVEIEDYKNNCENSWLYSADSNAPALLVYNLKQNDSWRVQDRSFDPDPNYVNYSIDGDFFKFADGIFTVALSPLEDGLYKRKLHYHAMSSDRESWVYLKYLKNRTNFEIPYGAPQLFYTYKGRRNQQSATEATDRKGNLYFSLLIDIELIKWNPNTPYKSENFDIIADDKERMQFPSGLKINSYKGNKCEEILWMFAVAYQRYEDCVLNGSIINFRLFAAKLPNN